MSIPPNSNFVDIQEWLTEKLLKSPSIKACCEEVTKVPTTKGIYFWFMKKEGYKELSKFEILKPSKDAISKEINGNKCDLVYLGTAGAKNNSNGTNTGNLQQRLKWHLCNNKSTSSLCNGTMSTYRRTLGALLASDLIDDDLQTKLDNFLCKYFYIYYIEYPGSFKVVKDEIGQDEDILINVLRPIFNLSKNPNAQNSAHLTGIIQKRRQLVERNSKQKHCKQVASDNTGKSSLAKIKIDTVVQMPGNNLCIEFKVKKHQNIAEVASGIIDLPVGPCIIELYSNNREIVKSYINGKIRTIRTEGRTVSQFFYAPDRNTPKWRLVQNEMNDKKNPIDVITVRVCLIDNNSKLEKNIKQIPNKNLLKTSTTNFIDEIINKNPDLSDKTKKKLLIINCGDAKSRQDNNLNNGLHTNYNFGDALNAARRKCLDNYLKIGANHFQGKKRGNAPVDRNYFIEALNINNRRPLFSVYGSNGSKFFAPNIKELYLNKIENSNLHILIISGLYGLLHHGDYINDYHLEISDDNNVWGNTISNAIKEFIIQNNIDNRHVFYCLSNKYRPFIELRDAHWQNLWNEYGLQGAQGKKNADDLISFLNQL